MICHSSDPLEDLYRHEDEIAEYEALCPVCDICGEHITDDYYYKIGDTVFHLECAECHSVECYVESKKYGY